MVATLNVGLWHEQGHAAALVILVRNKRSERIATAHHDDPWHCLVDALEQCKALKAAHVNVVSNDRALVQTFTRPIRIPQPTTVRTWMPGETVRVQRNGRMVKPDLIKTQRGQVGYWADVPHGGHMGMWRTAWLLFAYQSWKFLYSAKLETTREIWHERQKTSAR